MLTATARAFVYTLTSWPLRLQRAGADFDEKCVAQRLALSECANLAVGARVFDGHHRNHSPLHHMLQLTIAHPIIALLDRCCAGEEAESQVNNKSPPSAPFQSSETAVTHEMAQQMSFTADFFPDMLRIDEH